MSTIATRSWSDSARSWVGVVTSKPVRELVVRIPGIDRHRWITLESWIVSGTSTDTSNAPADPRRGSPDRRPGAAARRRPARRPAHRGRAADLPPARPHGRGGAQRRPRRLEPAGQRLRAGPAAAGARAGPHAVRAPWPGRRRPSRSSPWCARWRTSASTSPTWPPGRPRRAGSGEWLAANDAFRRRVLDLLATSGPLPSRDIPDTAEVPWASSGWTNDRNVTQMLEFLASRGEVAVAGRRGRHRLWDLAERVYPAGTAVVPADEARRDPRREAAALPRRRPPADRRRGRRPGRDRGHVRAVAGRPGGDGRGLRGPHRAALAVRPAHPRPGPRHRAVRLRVHPRDVQAEGQATLGVLRPPRAPPRPARRQDRRRRRPQGLAARVHAVHQDVRFTRAMKAAVDAELEALAGWLGLDRVDIA